MAHDGGGDGAASPPPPSPQFFSLAEYLTPEEAAGFFGLPHAAQIAKVAEYLDFLGRQPAAAGFTASSRAAAAHARLRATDAAQQESKEERELDGEVVARALAGKTRSGFGAFGTDAEFLPQKPLSLAVARVVEEIGHTYAIEAPRRKGVTSPPPPVLNSRSFFFYWCHAEKQKLVDIRQKLAPLPEQQRRRHWEAIEIAVDRAMCDDCVAFCEQLARFEGVQIVVQDPQQQRVFGAKQHEVTAQQQLQQATL
jgi:hypothetical protein